MIPLVLVAVAAVAGAGGVAAAALPDTSPWMRVLERFERTGGLDYAGLAADRADLDVFTASLGAARPEGTATDQQTAFWINAYNAVVAHFVLDRYPDLASVRDQEGFFDQRRFLVAGEERTLDQVESKALELGDPRVHFAVVCASTGCPDLRHEPFEAARLDLQLEEQTAAFLADPEKGMRFDEESNQVWLSSLFKWYPDDFTGTSRLVASFARGRVLDWVLERLPPERAQAIRQADPRVGYLDYDWSLNDRAKEPAR